MKKVIKKMAKGGGKSTSTPYVKASSPAYSRMTPDQRNKNTLAQLKNDFNIKTPVSSKSVKPKAKPTVVKKSTVKTPVVKKPEVAPIVKKKESTVAPKAKIETKPTSGSATNKPAGKTVAQMWQEKTGTSWSEAKKQGLTDGSAKANMKLMADMKSNSGNYSKRSTEASPEKLAPISAKKAAENLSPAKPTPELAKSSIPFKAGKSRLEKAVASKVGQMKKGGMVKKKK
jgi:hypothetical protein